MYSLGPAFMTAAETIEKERNIPREAFVQAICDAILAAYKKKVPGHNIDGVKTVFQEESCQIGIFAPLTVIETVTNEYTEISLEEAKAVLEDVQLGNISIGYTTDEPDLPIRKIELNIDASSNKIKSIFAERQEREGEKLLIRKILWTSGTELMVNTSYYKEGKLLNTLTERYNWAIGN